ncbi:MAG: CehA/McbA family metallohydrolase, partial [Actinobacteria bacterium]|nr:CehA/McbA family metallohydrolase [Actinomycetota bacterium]
HTPWLKGDFHAHSTLSPDGVLTPSQVIKEAEREGLDFFASTDHNIWAYPHFAASDEVLVIAGIEVTMTYGHFNVFAEHPDEPGWVAGLGLPSATSLDEQSKGASRQLIETIATLGLRSSINHPLLFPWEWTDPETPLANVRYLEVWNDPTWPENRLANPAALEMWNRWLRAGYRKTAIGGSDFHDPEKTLRPDGLIIDGHRMGLPRTYVLAEACTADAILDAVDRRRAYVTMGPTVEFSMSGPDRDAGIGDDLGPAYGKWSAMATTTGESELTLELVRDGVVVNRAFGHGPGLEHQVDLEPDSSGWFRIDVRTPTGDVVAFSNPIFFGSVSAVPAADYGSFIEISAARSMQDPQYVEAVESIREHEKEGT